MTNFLLGCIAFGLYFVVKRLLALQKTIELAPVADPLPVWTPVPITFIPTPFYVDPPLYNPPWELVPTPAPTIEPWQPTNPTWTTISDEANVANPPVASIKVTSSCNVAGCSIC